VHWATTATVAAGPTWGNDVITAFMNGIVAEPKIKSLEVCFKPKLRRVGILTYYTKIYSAQ